MGLGGMGLRCVPLGMFMKMVIVSGASSETESPWRRRCWVRAWMGLFGV